MEKKKLSGNYVTHALFLQAYAEKKVATHDFQDLEYFRETARVLTPSHQPMEFGFFFLYFLLLLLWFSSRYHENGVYWLNPFTKRTAPKGKGCGIC